MAVNEERAGETTTRRGLLGRFCGLSGGLFAAVAVRAPEAKAANWMCCTLAMPETWCSGPSYGDFRCANPSHKKVWYCCTLNQIVGCGECTYGADCEHGPFYCSYGWNTEVWC